MATGLYASTGNSAQTISMIAPTVLARAVPELPAVGYGQSYVEETRPEETQGLKSTENNNFQSIRPQDNVLKKTEGLQAHDSHHEPRRPLLTKIIAAGEAMGGSVPRAKKSSVHVRSHIRNRPNFVCYVFSEMFAIMNLSLPGPPAIELTLGISSWPGAV